MILIKRFKKRISTALINMQSIKYILNDAREQKNSRILAQNVFRYVKTVDMMLIYN